MQLKFLRSENFGPIELLMCLESDTFPKIFFIFLLLSLHNLLFVYFEPFPSHSLLSPLLLPLHLLLPQFLLSSLLSFPPLYILLCPLLFCPPGDSLPDPIAIVSDLRASDPGVVLPPRVLLPKDLVGLLDEHKSVSVGGDFVVRVIPKHLRPVGLLYLR
jgi:hypothetical protein